MWYSASCPVTIKYIFHTAPTTFLADILGLAVCCDPLIHSWINYTPVIRAAVTMAAVSKKNDKEAVLNNILLEATSPLKKGSGEYVNFVSR